jgi:hypothetical protein
MTLGIGDSRRTGRDLFRVFMQSLMVLWEMPFVRDCMNILRAPCQSSPLLLTARFAGSNPTLGVIKISGACILM